MRIAVLALSVLLALPGNMAAAAPSRLDPSPDAPGRLVVNAVFHDYLDRLVGAQIETAVVDVDSDGVGEILARFVHSGACREGMARCRTTLIRHVDGRWRIVLDRPADGVEIDGPRGKWEFSDVIIDGVRWQWRDRSYRPSLDGLGSALEMAPLPRSAVPGIAVAFGTGATRLASDGGSEIGFEFARPDLSQSGEFLLVRMTGDVGCGDGGGCPVRLLQRDGENWKSIMAASSIGEIGVSNVFRSGRRDLVLGTGRGFAVMGWSGSGYGVADVIEAIGGRN